MNRGTGAGGEQMRNLEATVATSQQMAVRCRDLSTRHPTRRPTCRFELRHDFS